MTSRAGAGPARSGRKRTPEADLQDAAGVARIAIDDGARRAAVLGTGAHELAP